MRAGGPSGEMESDDSTVEVVGPLTAAAFKRELAKHAERLESDGVRTCFRGIHLRGETFDGVEAIDSIFLDCDFSESRFRGAILNGAEFRGGSFHQTDFTGASLHGARFTRSDSDRCNLELAKLVGATASEAEFHGANLKDMDASGANFELADFGDAPLTLAVADRADLRGAKNVVVDRTSVRGAVFSVQATDLWSVLRRTYTGPRFLFNVLALLGSVPAMAAKAFALYGLALVEAAPLVQGPIEAYCSRPGIECREISLIGVLLGLHEGFFASFFVFSSLAVNGMRLMLTLLVSAMREEEERSGRTPALDTGFGLRHLLELARTPKEAWLRAQTSYGWLRHVQTWMGRFQKVVMVAFVAGILDIATATLTLPG